MPAWVPVESYELATGDSAFGTIIRVSDGNSPEVFHTIAGVGDIDGPNRSINVQEVRTHSTGNPYPNARPNTFGLVTLSFPVYFVASNPSHSLTSDFGLLYMLENRATRTWQIIYADEENTTLEGRGFVSELSGSAPVDGIAEYKCTVTIDGALSPVETPDPTP